MENGYDKMYLEEDLKEKLKSGERIYLNINGKDVMARDLKHNGEFNKKLIMVAVFKGSVLQKCFGVKKENFSKTHLRTIV